MKHRVLLDTVQYNSKPDEHVRKLNNRLVNSEQELSIEELAEAVSKGQAFVPATFSGKARKNINWEQQSIFCLDFDNNTSPELVKARLEEFQLGWAFFYSSFSDTPEYRKYRVVFQLPEPFTEVEDARTLMKQLMVIFPEADRACKDPARLFFGGKNLFYKMCEELSVSSVYAAASALAITTSSVAHYGRTLKKLGKYEKVVKITPSFNNILRAGGELTTFGDLEELPDITRHVDIDRHLSEKVLILNDLKTGRINSSTPRYIQMLGIITNMQYIEGGLKWVKGCMDKQGEFEPYHYSLLYTIPKMKYHPMNLDKFSPYEEDWNYANILSATGKSGYNVVPLNEVREVYSLEYAEKLLETSFSNALIEQDKKVTVIKTATGLGKTRLLESLPAGRRYTVATLTHALKDELHNRILANKNNKIKYAITPKLPECLSKEFCTHYEHLHQVGAHRAATKLLGVYKKTLKKDSEEKIALDEFSVANALAYSPVNDLSILTTHAKALGYRVDNKGNKVFALAETGTVIFDEDIMPALLKTGSITREELFRLKASCPKDYFAVSYFESLINNMDGMLHIGKVECSLLPTHELKHLVEEVTENYQLYSSDVLGFLTADFFCPDTNQKGVLVYITKRPVPDTKIVVLSATADEWMYYYYFGEENVNFIDISNVQIVGEFIQDNSISCSRASLSNPKTLEKVNNLIPDDYLTITFSQFNGRVKNALKDIYFGNCTGYDLLKGKNIAVVGCPHLPHVIYALYAAALGYNVTLHDMMMGNSRVRRNGYEFSIYTFIQNDFLRNIQFYCIERELIQAVGRARLLRTTAKVTLYSRYPLPGYENIVILSDGVEDEFY